MRRADWRLESYRYYEQRERYKLPLIGSSVKHRLPIWLVALLMSAVAFGMPQGSSPELLSKRVLRFWFYGNPSTESRAHLVTRGYPGGIQGAVMALAQHAEVRISFEALPVAADESIVPILVESQGRTVGEILEEIIRQDPRYEFRERLGVIEVLPKGAENDPVSCLNKMIPEFRVSRPFNETWSAIRCELSALTRDPGVFYPDPLAQNDPTTGGSCVGRGSHMSHPPRQPLQATFTRMPLRDILDHVVSMAGNVAWMAEWKSLPRSCANLSLGLYQPLGWYPKDPDDPGAPGTEDWIEGLPDKCTSCHYHEEQRR